MNCKCGIFNLVGVSQRLVDNRNVIILLAQPIISLLLKIFFKYCASELDEGELFTVEVAFCDLKYEVRRDTKRET